LEVLAKKSGVAQGDISVLESGKTNPKFNTLCKLADAMGMKIRVTFVPKDAT
jgi:transcriptional regulator with XRE-family HTH domain